MKPKKMGFIKILSYLYSKINSFEYSKVKERALFTKPRLNKGNKSCESLALEPSWRTWFSEYEAPFLAWKKYPKLYKLEYKSKLHI